MGADVVAQQPSPCQHFAFAHIAAFGGKSLRQVQQRFDAESQLPPQIAPAIRVVRMAFQQLLDDGYFLTQFLSSDGEGAPVIGNVGERVH